MSLDSTAEPMTTLSTEMPSSAPSSPESGMKVQTRSAWP